MFDMGYYGHYDDEDEYPAPPKSAAVAAPTKTPTEACRDLLLNLRFEQKKPEPDCDLMAKYRKDLTAFPDDVMQAAFGLVVDTQGW